MPNIYGLTLMLQLSLCPTGAWTGLPVMVETLAVQELRQAMEAVPPNANIASLADSVRAQLPRYDQTLKRAAKMYHSPTIRIDIIRQYHYVPHLAFEQDLQVHYSQWRTRQILDSLQYHLIAIEGFDLESVTLPGLVQAAHRQAAMMGRPVTTTDDSLYYQLFVVYSIGHVDGLLYLAEHPRAKVSGVDDDRLSMLHQCVLQQPGLSYDPPYPAVTRLAEAVSRLRSELAVAKTLTVMQKNWCTRGVIIMGADHDVELTDALRRYGVPTTVFSTEPTWPLPADWWK